jgi:enoyl-[acyl-carrier-protein] reductase (NADH)
MEQTMLLIGVSARIAFLCSPETAFVSGAVIHIDGGYHL